MRNRIVIFSLAAISVVLATGAALASSHREAPAITRTPQVDGTDFYMFRSYEPGRDDFVTLIANYIPLQDPFGGPNYFPLDPDAAYRIHIDNSGDGEPNLTFDFRAFNTLQDLQIPVGDASVSVPLRNIGPVTSDPESEGNLNVLESYTVRLTGTAGSGLLADVESGNTMFTKPVDNIGRKTFPNYAGYANQFLYDVEIPGCANGRVFVGQRKDSFVVNLGEIFDLVNIPNPLGGSNARGDDLVKKNVTSFILEIPIDCLTAGATDVIGGWTTAHLPRRRSVLNNPTFARAESTSGGLPQVSRLGMPLVNEIVIGLKDKNLFNASAPADDLQFATYVTNPTLPELLEILFGVEAPNNFPRQDLLATFITGITGLNEFGFGEMQRLNVTIPPTPRGQQERLGVIDGDLAGFPNGRRPGDDVVDIELRVAMGLLCHAFPGVFCEPEDAPSGLLPFTDGARQSQHQFTNAFPYLKTPLAGSPN